MYYENLDSDEQISYLIKPIIKVLQEAGGQLESSEIRARISELDEHIAEFEQFSRALLTKMGVQFTNKGVKISNDGGIDGYGYHIDEDDFRTTRVVIQYKRFNVNSVGEPEINQFLGAMNKYQADYGVFITNSRFTNQAREAAR